MNVAPFVPCFTGGSGGGTSAGTSADAPAGFLDLLAAHVTASGDASGEGDAAPDEGTDTSAQDLLMLAALASRTAHAALPLVAPVVTTETEAPADGEVADGLDQPDLVAPAPVVTTTADATTDVATDGGAVDGELEPAPVGTVTLPAAPATDPSAPQVGLDDAPVDTDAVPADAVADATDAPVPTDDPARAAPSAVARPADPGREPVASVPTDEEPPRTVAAPADTTRRRPDVPVAPARAEAAGSIRVDSVEAPSQPETATAVPSRVDQATRSSAAQRVLDIVSQLEDAPPPRVVVIETGEMRVRIGLDAGTVRMTVLGQVDEAGEEILREAADALEAGGFGTELDRSASDGRREPGDRDRDRSPGSTPTGPATARSTARTRSGLQL